MNTTLRGLLFAALAFVSLCGDAQAWSDPGHKIICEIAFRLAKQDTRAAISRLMESDTVFKTFSDSCVFPDHPRIRASEHFINLQRNSKGLTSDDCPKADKCVLTAILNDAKVLSSKEAADADRLIALKSLGHWVGDIHQPLHVSFEEDRGGNKISVNGQCSGNLHAAWDNCLVQYAVGPDISDAVTELLGSITPEQKTRWMASEPRDWANESFAIAEAVKTGYCGMHGDSCDMSAGSVTISAEYLDANEPVVKEQLQKAGVRLARVLDAAFGN
ncbi:S1/P1 nuclease [Bradyrhizobium sp.]|uniref:S1/P1 nuclease n=1 Tax=Bradyrhizobium sp. TaxID=376 RepID=UPI003C770877